MEYCYKCMAKIDAASCQSCGELGLEKNPYHLEPGTILQEKYLVGLALGAGGFGITYLGRDLILDTIVAIKEYFPSQLSVRNNSVSADITVTAGPTMTAGQAPSYENSKKRFLDEARILARFEKDAGIVKVKDFFEANNTAYMVMEYVDGLNLKEYLELNEPFPAQLLVDKMLPIIKSLSKVHEQGLIHRDISPDNIKLDSEGMLKLLDFGAARSFAADLEKTITSMTKAGYAPEEQYRSGGVQGPWSDVYALCATIYKCITGQTPPDSPQRLHEKTRGQDNLAKPSELGSDISPELEAIILRGMAVLQEDRYQSMPELLEAINNLTVPVRDGAVSSSRIVEVVPAPPADQANDPAPAQPKADPSPAPQVPDWYSQKQAAAEPKANPGSTSKKKLVSLAIGLALLLALVYFTATFWRNSSTKPRQTTPVKITASLIDPEKEDVLSYLDYKIDNNQVTITGFKPGGYYVKDLVIPEFFGEYPVVAIGASAFSGVDGIERVSLPDSVQELGDYAFRISTLQKIDLGKNLKIIGNDCFHDCAKLAEIILPQGLSTINAGAFRNCSSLTSLVMPDSVTFAGKNAFHGCTSLSSVRLSENLESIEEYLFADCTTLTEIAIPASVRQINEFSFAGCSKLTHVRISSGVEKIDGSPFHDSKQLVEVWLPPSIRSINSIVLLYNKDDLQTIFVEKGSYAEKYCNENKLTLFVKHVDFATLELENSQGD